MRLHSQLPMLLSLGAIVTAIALFAADATPAGAGGGGCHGASQTEASGTEVTMGATGGCFTPTILRVERGTSVTFINTDGAAHNLGGHYWGIEGMFQPGTSREIRFDSPGVYPYACTLHPGMVGAIVVGDGVMDAPATTGGVQSSKVAYAESNEKVTAAQRDATGTDGSQSTALWSAAALLTGAISAGAGGFLFGKRRRP